MKAKGWKQVFKFTFIQMIKSKAYIISTVVIAICILLMAIGLNFLPGLLAGSIREIFGGGEDGTEFAIKTLYISDQSGIEPAPDFGYLSEMGIETAFITPDAVDSITGLVNTSNEPVALIEITKSDYGYNLLASRPESEAQINAGDCIAVINYMNGTVWYAHMISIGVPKKI